MNKKLLSLKLLLGVFSVLLCSCGTATMNLPADVAGMDAQLINAVGRKKASGLLVNESFKLGPYGVSDVDRDWTSKRTTAAGELFKNDSVKSGYSFVFKGDGQAQGGCGIADTEKGVNLGNGVGISKSHSTITCRCSFSDGTVEAVLTSNNDRKYEGTLKSSDQDLSIKAIYNDSGFSRGTPAGYRIDGDGVLGAVEVYHPGRVWLNNGLSANQKQQYACIFAGLMLYKPETKF